jgi:hypothetical protein
VHEPEAFAQIVAQAQAAGATA